MTDIIIIGAGGHAAEIFEYINHYQKIAGTEVLNVIGFLDDNPASYARYRFSAPYLGGLKEYKANKGQHFVMGIANLKYRRFFIDRFILDGADFVSFIHHTAYVSESAFIGEGTVVGPNVNIGPNVKIGKYNLINSRCSIGHDTEIGCYNLISPNVCFSGFSRIGDENLFGINAATIPSISVGSRNKIFAGMILDKDVGDDSVVFYRYKERVIAVPRTN